MIKIHDVGEIFGWTLIDDLINFIINHTRSDIDNRDFPKLFFGFDRDVNAASTFHDFNCFLLLSSHFLNLSFSQNDAREILLLKKNEMKN